MNSFLAATADWVLFLYADVIHTFSPQVATCGFTDFLPLAELRDPANGYLVNDSLQIEVSVKVERLASDSKKETGYVGLKNQGATSYISTSLQALYNISYFRQVSNPYVIRNVVIVYNFLNYTFPRLC